MAALLPADVIHSYRSLYRGLLRAVQFSKPARYTARDQLRDAFRLEDPKTYNQDRINRTVEFLRLATVEAGLEHRILKNLLRINWERRELASRSRTKTPHVIYLQGSTMAHYDLTIAMLNNNMGLCLR
ncbi:hypothetical protein BJ878DRAFT_4017 [Calycina marina]|uniref:Uncharacterized protein n=1 Tax=Calycina marina TaxID=1763456 RepID=A0A9P7ZAM7_9HELO|nr:hypothetical protein BJ878DRAFT_4017 [Calycina marina]